MYGMTFHSSKVFAVWTTLSSTVYEHRQSYNALLVECIQFIFLLITRVVRSKDSHNLMPKLPAKHICHDIQCFQLNRNIFLFGNGISETSCDFFTDISCQSRSWKINAHSQNASHKQYRRTLLSASVLCNIGICSSHITPPL